MAGGPLADVAHLGQQNQATQMNNWTVVIAGVFSAIAILCLAGCGQENEVSHKADVQDDAEQELLADPTRALPELIR
jgi:hypothetical protein